MGRALGAVTLALAGCGLIGGADDLHFAAAGGGGSAQGGAASSGAAGAAGGAGCVPEACSSADACKKRACVNGACEEILLAAGVACEDGVCNGAGECVPCVKSADCKDAAKPVCIEQQCMAASCFDGLANGGESDVDCGGPCPKCPDGKKCAQPEDCVGFCAGGTCAACSVHGECEASAYCKVGGACGAKLAAGASCATAEPVEPGGAACATGHCVDGVCCDGACGGVCEACDGAPLGVCAPVPAAKDPATDCGAMEGCMPFAVAGACNGSGTCVCGAGASWAHRFGAAGADGVGAIAVAPDGKVLIAGFYEGTVTTGSDGLGTGSCTPAAVAGAFEKILLVRVEPANGSCEVLKNYGDNEDDRATAAGYDASGNLFVAGFFDGAPKLDVFTLADHGNQPDVFVAKLDANMNAAWAYQLGANNQRDEATGLAVDGKGDVVVAGSLNGPLSAPTTVPGLPLGAPFAALGGDDAFVLKLDGPTGAYAWGRRFGSSAADQARGVAIDAQNDIVVTGFVGAGAVFDVGTVPGIGGRDAFVAKYAASGSHLWSKIFGGGGADEARAVAVDAKGDVVVAGFFGAVAAFDAIALIGAGGDDVFVAKLDGATGAVKWARSFGDAADQRALAVAVDKTTGDVVVVGQFEGGLAFGAQVLAAATGADAFVAKLSGVDGAPLWADRYGRDDGGAVAATAVAVDAGGGVLVGGDFEGAAGAGVLDVSFSASLAYSEVGLADLFFLKRSP
jgi:hypothetical protein